MAIDSVPLPRTLAAILYADAVGFSRMTEADEDTTYKQLRDFLDVFSAAIDTFQDALERNPASDRVRVWLGAALAQGGKQDEAEWEAEQVLVSSPDFSLTRFLKAFPFRKSEDKEHFLSGLQ